MARLICELIEEISYVTEATADGKKNVYIEGVYMVAGTKNKNGRIYPNAVMEQEVQRYMEELVSKNRAYGELGHPQGPNINLDRVSHMIKELKMDGNNVIGKALVFDTPSGQIVKRLLEDGANLGVSSRGMGSLKENKEGIMEVQNDFRLATAADVVADPSAPGAFVKGIMEDTEWYYDVAKGTWAQTKVEPIKESLKKMTTRQITEVQLGLWESFLKGLVQKRH